MEELEKIMKEKNIKISDMIKMINISRSAFYRKRRGITEFTRSEIEEICKILGIESGNNIFLSKKFPKGNRRRRL